MMLLIYFIAPLVFITTSDGAFDINCDRIPSAVKECPRAKANTNPSQQQCSDAGCHYCGSLIPTCVEGAACVIKNKDTAKECPGRRIRKPKDCYSRGCSWCDSRTGFKCVEKPKEVTDIELSPICTGQKTGNEYDCRTSATETMTPEECVQRRGCSWCPANSAFKCVKDPSVGPPPNPICEKTTSDHDCRLSDTETISKDDCLKRPGCSWCPDNAFKCVKDPSVEPPPECKGTEKFNCFSFPTGSVTKQQCLDRDGCVYCEAADEGSRCKRSKCPDGWLETDAPKSCCKPTSASEGSSGTSWLVRYEAGDTVCDGFLASPSIAITAGRCRTFGRTGSGGVSTILGKVVVDIGGTDTSISVVSIAKHPYYINVLGYHDIAALKLENPVPSSTAQYLRLPDGTLPPINSVCRLVSSADGMTDIPVSIKSIDECVGKDEFMEPGFQFCASATSGGAMCPGRVGSVLVCRVCDSCEWYPYGILSYHLYCKDPYPPYFTELPAYRDFLQSFGLTLSIPGCL